MVGYRGLLRTISSRFIREAHRSLEVADAHFPCSLSKDIEYLQPRRIAERLEQPAEPEAPFVVETKGSPGESATLTLLAGCLERYQG